MVLLDIPDADMVNLELQLVPLLCCRVLRQRYKELQLNRTLKRIIPNLYAEIYGFANEEVDDIIRENVTRVSSDPEEEDRQYKKFLFDWKLLHPDDPTIRMTRWPEAGGYVISLSPRCTKLLKQSRMLNSILAGGIKKPLRVKHEEKRHRKHYVRKSHSVDRFIDRD